MTEGVKAPEHAHGDHPIGVRLGAPAPDFILPDQDNVDFKLADYKGKRNVVLFFYPLDWSPVCTKENACWTQDLGALSAAAEVAAVSVDSLWSHRAYAKANGYKHRLLSDMQRSVSKAYGLLIEPLNFCQRATVVVGKDGRVAWFKVQHNPSEQRDHAEVLKVLQELK